MHILYVENLQEKYNLKTIGIEDCLNQYILQFDACVELTSLKAEDLYLLNC